MIVTTEVAVPLTLLAVNVYCVVEVGVTDIDPENATTPTPLSIVTVEAYAVDQINVADFPGAIVVGEAEMLAVGGTGAGAGSKPAPRQPDSKPAPMQIKAIIKRFMAKYTPHHPYKVVTVLSVQKTFERKERESQNIYPLAKVHSAGNILIRSLDAFLSMGDA